MLTAKIVTILTLIRDYNGLVFCNDFAVSEHEITVVVYRFTVNKRL